MLLYLEGSGKADPSKGVRRVLGQHGVLVGLEFSILNL